jgi:putative inorganic carbon (HCO3(-)) transporter
VGNTLSKKKIEVLLLLLTFLTPLIFTFRATTYNIPKIAAVEILAFFAFVLWLMNISFTRQFRIINSPLNLPILAFLIWEIASVFWAANRFETMEVVFFNTALAAIYFMALGNAGNARAFVTVMIAAGSIVSIYGILQYLGIDFTTPKSTPLVSTLGNVNFAGEYLSMIIPLSVAMVFHSRGKTPKIAFGTTTALMLTHLLLAKSRGAWAGLAGAGIILLFLNPAKKGYLKPLLYLALTIAVAFSIIYTVSGSGGISSIKEEAVSVLNMRQSSILFRFLVWKSALRMIRESPLTGTGAGNFKIIYPLYRSSEEWHVSGINARVVEAHNDYLQIASELGLIGLGIFIWLLVNALRIFKKLLKTESILITGLLASVISMLISAVFEFPFHNPATALTFWMILGISGALCFKAVPTGQPLQKKPGMLLAGAAILIGIAPLYTARAALSDFHLRKVMIYQSRKSWDKTIDECEKSINAYYPNTQAHVFLARALLEKEETEKAFVELKTLLRLHPNDPWAHRHLGEIYLKLNQFDSAISSLSKAAELNPAYLNNLGAAYTKKGMLNEALSSFQKAAATGWDDELTYTYMGIIYEKKGDPDKATLMYKKALQLNPDYEPALKTGNH